MPDPAAQEQPADEPDGEPPAADLSLVSTNELITELFRRHDAALIVLMERRTPDYTLESVCHSGGGVTALGLAEYARWHLQDGMTRRRNANPPEA